MITNNNNVSNYHSRTSLIKALWRANVKSRAIKTSEYAVINNPSDPQMKFLNRGLSAIANYAKSQGIHITFVDGKFIGTEDKKVSLTFFKPAQKAHENPVIGVLSQSLNENKTEIPVMRQVFQLVEKVAEICKI